MVIGWGCMVLLGVGAVRVVAVGDGCSIFDAGICYNYVGYRILFYYLFSFDSILYS